MGTRTLALLIAPGPSYLSCTESQWAGGLVSSVGHVGAAVAPRSASTQRRALIAAGTGGLVLTVLAFAIVFTSDQPGDRLLTAFGRVLVIAVPIAVGIWFWSQAQYERFGRLLVAAGYLWFLAALAESSNSVLYSTGRIGAWVAETIVIYLVLSFPSGRLRTTRERVLVGGMVVFTVLLFAPVTLIQERIPAPTYWASCGGDCPANAFFVLSSQPDFVDAWIRPVRLLLVTSVFVATAVLLALRIQAASYLMRKTLAPVLVIAIVRCLAFLTVAVVMRDFGLFTDGFELVGWILVLCLPGVSLAFLVGVLRRRLHAGSALQRLARRLRDDPNVRLPVVIGEAVADPSLEVAYWMPGPPAQWIDEAGRSVALPGKYSARSTTEVRGRDGPLALLIHDRALDDQQEFLGAVGSIAGAALENRRLAAQVEASLEELHESRARIQAAADAERQRMERDLHDGAQQRLVALRVRVELAGELAGEDPGSGVTLLHELGSELEQALDEVRALARGIYPPLLADLGIVKALRAVGRRHPVQTTIEADGVGRYPPELERTVYFCCLEALQNAAKHASSSTVSITLADDGALRFAVRDDGIGFAAGGVRAGQGLTNMRDRLAAVGGELTIESAPGKGTSVLGVIPRP